MLQFEARMPWTAVGMAPWDRGWGSAVRRGRPGWLSSAAPKLGAGIHEMGASF